MLNRALIICRPDASFRPGRRIVYCQAMRQYHDLMRHVLEHGRRKDDRTGTGTLSVFGYQMRFDLAGGFPLITTKKLHVRSIVHELLWFIRGDTNVKYLHDHKISIWDDWADADGDLGPIYGAQWRSWPARDGATIDQLAKVIALIRKQPGFAPPHRDGVEPRRSRAHGAATLPLPVPVLMSPTGGCPASSTSARPTFSWACRSTSRRTRCSPTWSPTSPV